MIFKSFLIFVPALLNGFILLCLICPGGVFSHLLLKISLSAGVGLGISSCLFFFWCLVFSPENRCFAAAEWLLLLCLFMTLLYFKKPSLKSKLKLPTISLEKNWLAILTGSVLAVLIVLTLYAFKNYTFMYPHGTFDAYAIWNLKARFIFRDPGNWQKAFSPLLNWKFHADYPLLLSLNVARAWLQMGIESTRVPILISGIFLFSTLILLFSATAVLRDSSQASIGALLLLSAPWLTYYATTQNAAIPTAYYYLATCFMLANYMKNGYKHELVLAGLLSGLAAWTKNEGLVFLLACFISIFFFSIRQKSSANLIYTFTAYLSGLFVPLAAIVYFKVFLAPPNDILEQQTILSLAEKVLDVSRLRSIFLVFWQWFVHLGEWNSPVFLLALIYGLLFLRKPPFNWNVVQLPAAVVLLTLAGYFGIYLVTPHPLDWHLKYSADRLLFHIFPAFLFIIFISTKTPFEIIHSIKHELDMKEQK